MNTKIEDRLLSKRRYVSIINSKWFNLSVAGFILLSALLAGLDTYHPNSFHIFAIFILIDSFFILEILIRIIGEKKQWYRFFFKTANIYDFGIVILVIFFSHVAAILRITRLFRILRVFTRIDKLRTLLESLIKSVTSLFSVACLLFLQLYIYAVVATTYFGEVNLRNFGTLHKSLLSLFKVLTLDNWTTIMGSQLEARTPHEVIVVSFFLSFIILGTMIILNFFIGVIMQTMLEKAGMDYSVHSIRYIEDMLKTEVIKKSGKVKTQKKFLLKDLNFLTHYNDKSTKKIITQAYLLSVGDREERIRCEEENNLKKYYRTTCLKKKNEADREINTEISESEYNNLLKYKEKGTGLTSGIDKIRYELKDFENGKYKKLKFVNKLVIDKFLGEIDLWGLNTLELHINSNTKYPKWSSDGIILKDLLPKEIQNSIICEIDYKNRELAKDGRNALGYPPELLRPCEMPEIEGIKVPLEFYQILKSPTLAGMSYPRSDTPWEAFFKLGFTSIVCLTENKPGYDPSPLKIIYAADIEDLIGGKKPANPRKEKKLFENAVAVARKELLDRRGVIVHCKGGTGRTGTAIGAILRSFGYETLDVINYLDGLNRERNTNGWPESEWQAEIVKKWSHPMEKLWEMDDFIATC